LAIIRELMQFKINEYLLPGKVTGHVGIGYLNMALTNLTVGIEPFRIHDLRRTMRTHLGKLGVDRFVAERCLNHKIAGMEGVYDAGDYFTERKAALAKWAAFLESCEAGKAWNAR
jgi:integrase